MSSPTVQVIKPNVTKQGGVGACREYWFKIGPLSAAADNDAADSPIYVIENPYAVDLVITQALINITTLSANAVDIDIGLADNAASLNKGAEIQDGMISTTAGVLNSLIMTGDPTASATFLLIWKAQGSTTDSFIDITQKGDVDGSAIVWWLLLKCVPRQDMQ
jgi:hypothetical protein